MTTRDVIIEPRWLNLSAAAKYTTRSEGWVRSKFRGTPAFIPAFGLYDRLEIDRIINAAKSDETSEPDLGATVFG